MNHHYDDNKLSSNSHEIKLEGSFTSNNMNIQREHSTIQMSPDNTDDNKISYFHSQKYKTFDNRVLPVDSTE